MQIDYVIGQKYHSEGTSMAVSLPIEIRYYLKLATLDDIVNGIQPLRQQTANGLQLFAPPVLQVRCKVKGEGGNLEWSDWQEIKYAREGDELAH